jgi:hypothetical protein
MKQTATAVQVEDGGRPSSRTLIAAGVEVVSSHFVGNTEEGRGNAFSA